MKDPLVLLRPGTARPRPNGGPAGGLFFGCEDVDYTPAYPLTARIMATLFLD